MSTDAPPALSDIDLGSLEFWSRPAVERDRAFAVLRREAPVSHHQPLEDILGLAQRDELGYWAGFISTRTRRKCSQWLGGWM